MKKHTLQIGSLLIGSTMVMTGTISPVVSAKTLPIRSEISSLQSQEKVLTFTNKDVSLAATKLYERNKISLSEHQQIMSLLSERWGFKGENKLVITGVGTCDLYLNNVLSGIVIAGGVAAVGLIIAAIPPIAAWIAAHGIAVGVLSVVLGAGIGAYTTADNGLVFSLSLLQGGLTCTGVREQ